MEPREFGLLWYWLSQTAKICQSCQKPVIKWTMVFKFERADRVGDVFEGVGDRMRVVVHRVDAPPVTRAVMTRMTNPVHDRITQVQIGRRHVDPRAQHMGAFSVLTVAHFAHELEVLRRATVAPRARLTGLCERAAGRSHRIGAL